MLPPELVYDVIASIARGSAPDQWFRDLSLVCKAWTRPIQTVIFSQFTLGAARPGRLSPELDAYQTRQLAFFASRPDLAVHVTHLRVFHLVSPTQNMIQHLATTFPALAHAEFRVSRGQLEERTIGDVLAAFPHVRNVVFQPLWYLGTFDAKALVRASVALNTLDLAGSCPLVADVLDALAQTASKETLRNLSVRYMGRTWSDALARCSRSIFQFPDLRTLRLAMSGVIDPRGEPSLLRSDVTFGFHACLRQLRLELTYLPDVAACVLHAFLAHANMPSLCELHLSCRDVVDEAWVAGGTPGPLLPHALAQSLNKLTPPPQREPAPKREAERCASATFDTYANHSAHTSIAVQSL